MDEREFRLRMKEIELKERNHNLREREVALNAWKAIVDVQMHFNEILMRVRNWGITLLLAAFGAGTFMLRYDIYVELSGYRLHVGTLVLFLGLAGWLIIGMFDWGYYHRLLIGAVIKSTEIEERYANDVIFGMTRSITKESRKFGPWTLKARNKVFLFYLVVFILGALFAYAIALQPDDGRTRGQQRGEPQTVPAPPQQKQSDEE